MEVAPKGSGFLNAWLNMFFFIRNLFEWRKISNVKFENDIFLSEFSFIDGVCFHCDAGDGARACVANPTGHVAAS